MLEVGQLLDGKYRILDGVNQSEMSDVYFAIDESNNKLLAVKEAHKNVTIDLCTIEQELIAETDMLKKLKHPHLPGIADIIDTTTSYIIIMDYINGYLLDEVVRDFGAQPEEAVIDWAKQLCDVYIYLHGKNPPIICRNPNLCNITLQSDISDEYPWGKIYLIDFVTARINKSFREDETDVFGLRYDCDFYTNAGSNIMYIGATMYSLVTGRPLIYLIDGYKTRHNPSRKLKKIITKCMERYPISGTYQSCNELKHDLMRIKTN